MDRDQLGRLRVNEKVISEAAIEQRLRRFTAVKKNGKVKSGSDIKERLMTWTDAKSSSTCTRSAIWTRPGI